MSLIERQSRQWARYELLRAVTPSEEDEHLTEQIEPSTKRGDFVSESPTLDGQSNQTFTVPQGSHHRAKRLNLVETPMDGHIATIKCFDCAGKILYAFRYVRDHLRKFPGHLVGFGCHTCGKSHSLAAHPKGRQLMEEFGISHGRGGRRPGAGAPKGNLNALRTGNRTANPTLKAVFGALAPDQRPPVIGALKARRRDDKAHLVGRTRQDLRNGERTTERLGSYGPHTRYWAEASAQRNRPSDDVPDRQVSKPPSGPTFRGGRQVR